MLQPVEREGVAFLDAQVRQSVRYVARDHVGAFFAVERVCPLGIRVIRRARVLRDAEGDCRSVPEGHGLSRLDRVVDEMICPVVVEDPVEPVLARRHVTIIPHIGPVALEVLLEAWHSVEAFGRLDILSPLIAEVAYDPVHGAHH